MLIDSSTNLYCIFGNPVRHSLSPAMHNSAFRSCGINAVYLAFQPDNIADAIASFRTLKICGASITIPFKIDVMPFLDRIDPLASLIGSVNTLHNQDGIIRGYNTDGYGALAALEKNGVNIKGSKCLIIGSGGSARAIGFTLSMSGAEVYITGIDLNAVEKLVQDISAVGKAISIKDGGYTPELTAAMDVLINTTPVGMEPDISSTPIDAECLHAGQTVFDIVYAPLKTRLLVEAGEKGCRTISGLSMLLYQGVRQFEIWTGLQPPIDIMEQTLARMVNHL